MINFSDGQEAAFKACRDCGELKPADEFWKLKSSSDGLAMYCVPCFSRRNADAYRRKRSRLGEATKPYRGTLADRRAEVPDGMKRCPDCGEVLPRDAFVRNRTTKDGVGAYCRPCQNARAAESRQRLHGGSRHYHLKRRYGIGAVEVEEMLESQGWACPICATTLTAKTCHVDHDHKTGAVRGILCFNCNGGLGQFRDDPRALRQATAYLGKGRAWGGEATSRIEVRWTERLAEVEFGTAS
jgi:hypothetical protein